MQSLKKMAEGVGFEPTCQDLTPTTRFRVERVTAGLRYPSARLALDALAAGARSDRENAKSSTDASSHAAVRSLRQISAIPQVISGSTRSPRMQPMAP